MARPVSGFLSSFGEFFETEAEANLHETSRELNQVFRRIFRQVDNGDWSDDEVDLAVEVIMDALKDYAPLVKAYVEAVAAFSTDVGGGSTTSGSEEAEVRSEDETLRSPETSDQGDAERVSPNSDAGVADAPDAETDASADGAGDEPQERLRANQPRRRRA